ncbi:MAG TPA: hypothetical protein VFL04_00900 [Rectinemataceae bacterium]|nr:hypothetical protein [Rectinemataceae bacterium]
MRLCVPSYLVPGTWLENLEAMRDEVWIEGVELLFFAWDRDAQEILAREGEGIAALSSRFDFSLHLPDRLGPEALSLVEATESCVSSYIAHPPPSADDAGAWARLLGAWRERFGDRFLLEYTGATAFARGEEALPGLPLCADTGKLLVEGIEPSAWIGPRSGRIGEVHLHGAEAGRDHRPFGAAAPWLRRLLPFLVGFEGRVNIEVFELEAARSAALALAAALAGRGGP